MRDGSLTKKETRAGHVIQLLEEKGDMTIREMLPYVSCTGRELIGVLQNLKAAGHIDSVPHPAGFNKWRLKRST